MYPVCFAARGSFKPSGLTSRLAKVGAPEDELCDESDRRVCVLSEDASSLSRENYYGTASAKATADALNAQVGHGGADHSQPYLNLEYSCMEMHEGNKQCETRRVKDHRGFVCRCVYVAYLRYRCVV